MTSRPCSRPTSIHIRMQTTRAGYPRYSLTDSLIPDAWQQARTRQHKGIHMLTGQSLLDLRTLIATHAPAESRDTLMEAFDDLQRTIAAQSLAIRNLTADLRNRHIGDEAMNAIVPSGGIADLASRLGEPRSTPFSLAEARAACDELATQAARATDIAAIATGIIRVVRVFV